MGVMQARRALRRTPAAFDPRSILGLALWLEARFVQGVAAGAAAATWTNQAGVAGNATQATGAAQPLLIMGQANGQPILRFDATDDALAGTLSGVVGTNGATLVVVSKFNGVGGTRGAFDTSDNGATNRALMLFISGASLFGRWGAGGASYAFADTTKFHVHSLNHQATTRTISLDGAAQNTEVTTPTTTTPTTYTVGTLTGTASEGNSDYAAVLLWNRSLGASEQKSVERGLGGLYGVPIS